MVSISIIKGATSVKKRGCKSSKTKKFFFFAQIPHAFIQCNVKSTYKAEATATFSILALISEIWAFKIKK